MHPSWYHLEIIYISALILAFGYSTSRENSTGSELQTEWTLVCREKCYITSSQAGKSRSWIHGANQRIYSSWSAKYFIRLTQTDYYTRICDSLTSLLKGFVCPETSTGSPLVWFPRALQAVDNLHANRDYGTPNDDRRLSLYYIIVKEILLLACVLYSTGRTWARDVR